MLCLDRMLPAFGEFRMRMDGGALVAADGAGGALLSPLFVAHREHIPFAYAWRWLWACLYHVSRPFPLPFIHCGNRVYRFVPHKSLQQRLAYHPAVLLIRLCHSTCSCVH